ncbi:riboflavin synthase [candidate division WOR-3 bacterium]|nr:riboflavin synthase [candidate division WOR-3 bacterium]
MFTGLVEAVGKVISLRGEKGGLILRISVDGMDLEVGESVAINGACLTVLKVIGKDFEVFVGSRTQTKTNLSRISVGKKVNLERALRLGDRLGGHLVQGHIDGVGKVSRRSTKAGGVIFRIKVPSELSKYLIVNGSIAIDGVSLTIGDVKSGYFEVGLIPYTLEHTTLKDLRAGDNVNLEVDIIGRYLR